MTRIACLLSLASCMMCLTIAGVVEPSVPAFAQQVKKAMAKPKAVQADPEAIFVQQFAPQFRQLHKSELHLMREVCQPTKQQFEKIAADSEPALKETLKKFGPRIANGMGIPNGDSDQNDPRKPVADAIAKSVRSVLSPEVAVRYQKELDLRAAANKKVVVNGFVCQIDKILVLTTDQRDQLAKILDKSWKDAAGRKQYLQYAGQYFPAMPDREINAILTEAQKSVWNGISKGNVNFGFDQGLLQGIGIEDEVWSDARPPEKVERKADEATGKSKGAEKAKSK